MLPYATIWILRLQTNSTFTDSIIPIHAFTAIRLFTKQIMQKTVAPLKAMLIIIAALSDTSGHVEGSSAESLFGHVSIAQ